ncbi:MAG: FAD-dependent oxidoreductase [Burkholderiales bacterium]|nr:FAD-dependent oxidoreductase [Burkholderiales bacterium]
MQTRRDFLKASAAGAAVVATTGCAGMRSRARGNVVVIGGGYGGVTAAKYIRLWSNHQVDVTLVERNAEFISCPLSNLVLGGYRKLADLTVSYDAIQRNHGVKLIRDEALAVDPVKREVKLAGGALLKYDRLVVSPGVDFMYETIPGLNNQQAQEQILHGWKAGPQTITLRSQLQAMPDGGVYAMHIPKAPYRCPPGPYERACQVASYFKQAKPKSKVLILDANEDVVSKKGLFMKSWQDLYGGIVEYRPSSELQDVDVKTRTAKLLFGDVKADVLNVIPPQKAARIAESTGLITTNNRWCEVDFQTLESKAIKNIHVLGDATLSAQAMPKSGHMANQHAKVCADAIVALLAGDLVNPNPMMANTCYSFVSDKQVIHVSSVHVYDDEKRALVPVQGSGGVSAQASEQEGSYGQAWAKNIWADMLG